MMVMGVDSCTGIDASPASAGGVTCKNADRKVVRQLYLSKTVICVVVLFKRYACSWGIESTPIDQLVNQSTNQ